MGGWVGHRKVEENEAVRMSYCERGVMGEWICMRGLMKGLGQRIFPMVASSQHCTSHPPTHPSTHPYKTHSTSFQPPALPLPSQPPTHLPQSQRPEKRALVPEAERFKDIKIEYRDADGRLLTTKEEFRRLNYKFHG